MLVEILHVHDCPGHLAARALLRRLLRERGLRARVHEVAVRHAADARRLDFRGSPTIRINGRDVAPDERGATVGLCCRLYAGDGGEWLRLPPEAAIVRALDASQRREGGHGKR